MSRWTGVSLVVSMLALSGCSSLSVLGFSAAENSGITKNQRVTVAYIRPVSSQGSCVDNAETCFDFEKAGIPEAVADLCTQPRIAPLVPAAVLPFVMAAGQIAFDAILGAIDSKREQLKKAAVKQYGATAIATDFILGIAGPDIPECVIVQRFAGDPEKRAMVAVNYLQHHMTDNDQIVSGLTWSTAYLKVDYAAAQTGTVQEGKPKIALTETLSIGAIQPDPKTEAEAVELVTASTFNFPAVELGVEYINPAVISGMDFSPEDRKELKIPDGPLFVPLRRAPTVGSISAAIVERGSAADLKDVSAAETSIRASIRGAIGASLKARFTEE